MLEFVLGEDYIAPAIYRGVDKIRETLKKLRSRICLC
jgi:hypothetical protein